MMFKLIEYGRIHAMIRRGATLLTGAVAGLVLLAFPAISQTSPAKNQPQAEKSASPGVVIDGIDFGTNTSEWANDGECDDPRFIGAGTAVDMVEEDLGRDAADCSALYRAGEISLKPDPSDIVDQINFGTNTSEWADNNICDDPRFGGPGTDELLLDEDIGRDANDCRRLFLAGEVRYLGDDPNMEIIEFDGIVFGDNTSQWANDEECDDPRFLGVGMAGELVNDNLEHDANDCLALYQAGAISLVQDMDATDVAALDFGDDSSQWANDGECDDPRFAGEGVASLLLDEDLGRDATDCRNLYQAGKIYLASDYQPGDQAGGGGIDSAAIDFGDDSNPYANDGECDDPRFAGPGVAEVLLDEDLGRDATDCRQLFESGQIYLAAGNDGSGNDGSGMVRGDIYFGDDSSEWANDGECDDPRFVGNGMAAQLNSTDVGRDATDCRTLLDGGQVELINAQNVDFGDDSSEWANDGECDDPRFGGPGSAIKLDPRNFGRDATDCKNLLQSGQVEYVGGILAVVSPSSLPGAMADVSQPDGDRGANAGGAIDFGDDSSEWANDGECDDPRFSGPGSASMLLDEDLGRDATDCRQLLESGQVTFIGGQAPMDGQGPEPGAGLSGIDFGDDSSEWANNGICDDARFEGEGVDPILFPEDVGRDASDCASLFEQGKISLAEGGQNDNVFAGGPQEQVPVQGDAEVNNEAEELNFGDDSSVWANDGECDDPRFTGPGTAEAPLSPLNLLKDASDCRSLFEKGEITLL